MAAQTKTGSTVHTRSRRKLNFGESQRFKGKTFFLDLSGYRRVNELEEELISRGATVEKFLHRSVRYIVTNKSKDDIKKATTNLKTPSGHSPHTPSTGGLSQLLSPYSNQSSSSDKKATKPPYYTRAQKILQMSLEKRRNCSGTSDVLALGISWNCKILHVDAVEMELKKLRPVTAAITKGEGIKKSINMFSVRKLRQPFLKVEDLSRQYRPIVYEPSCWPTPNTHCSPKACPFDQPRPDAAHRKVVTNEKRMGFCEPCSVRFENLEVHLKSSQHQEYACNPKNFEKLDKLISQCMNFKDFLTELIQQSGLGDGKSDSPVKSISPLRRDGLTVCPDRVSMVSLPSREGPLVILSDYSVHQPLDQSPGVCTRQMKRKLVESSPNLLLPDYKRTRTSV